MEERPDNCHCHDPGLAGTSAILNAYRRKFPAGDLARRYHPPPAHSGESAAVRPLWSDIPVISLVGPLEKLRRIGIDQLLGIPVPDDFDDVR